MLHHPVKKGPLKSDVTPLLFALAPFMTENFLPLCLKFPVEGRILQQITCIH